ncbi:von Willebrand factor A domain-containing protein 3A-like [Coregonus clupeaformis]|uniref:von Willebrand factor A domain-containing protein 3A-like n=1 Tax=Coregonus clupeaformis TaxID=59861 RepID=UPI001E1C9C68|nr:von Willebrand factor A domain-containing protein 3A-like [Coregonus clupeaformis]
MLDPTQKAMVQFEWHDGTVKNIHVDLPLIYHYQKQLMSAVAVLERRVQCLSSGSRQIWGTVCEQRFDSAVRTWRERLAPPHTREPAGSLALYFSREAVLCWWVQGLQCSGSRNTMAALRLLLEGDLHGGGTPPPSPSPLLPPSSPLIQGLYLFTSGVPDQEMSAAVACLYVSTSVCSLERRQRHRQGGCPPPRHATREETAGALRELAQAGNGCFHWISETGILESDDITALIGEMERAANYWQKSSMLVDSLTQKSGCRCPGDNLSPGDKAPAQPPPCLETQRRTTAPTATHSTHPRQAGRKAEQTSVPTLRRLSHGVPAVPHLVSHRWLKRFSIKKQKLDLYKLVSGPDCTHHKKLVPSVLKRVSAKYCSIFPSVHINGMVKHLQLTPAELKLTQTERLLQRYTQRLQWLLSGSRRVFGAVLEREVCVLLDVSGSMAPCLGELKTKLASLIWEQLHHNTVRLAVGLGTVWACTC